MCQKSMAIMTLLYLPLVVLLFGVLTTVQSFRFPCPPPPFAHFQRQSSSTTSTIPSSQPTKQQRTVGSAIASLLTIVSLNTMMMISSYPLAASAVSGAAPKQEFFKAEDTSSVGESVYDEGEKKAINEKLAGVVSRWSEMMTEVTSKTGNDKADRMEMKSILARDMTDLKTDMRRISKVACGGDIAANFDYNSGTYAYQPIPQKAENIFTQITDVYVDAVRAEPQTLDQEITKANQMFEEWLALTKTALLK